MVIPRPQSMTADPGSFVLGRDVVIQAPAAGVEVAQLLQQWLRPATGLGLPIVEGAGESRAVRLEKVEDLAGAAYRLTVTTAGVSIEAAEEDGWRHGCQVLRQLLPAAIYRRARSEQEWAVPCVRVEDAPRFAWRGAMLDVARHFQPKHDVLRFLDLMAMHRLNVFHLHLTEDQGWRLEIHRYPRLTEVGGWRRETQVGAGGATAGTDGRPHGGFYTQDDIREIVAYATNLGITVVPEIEVPGHAQAAIAAHPELGVTGQPLEVLTSWGINRNVFNAEDATITFMKHVLDEVMELFPGTHIGIGGDECPKDQWHSDERTQELMRQRGIADEVALQAWFVAQLVEHLRANGRRAYGWDELLEGELPEGTTVASWRGMAGARTAARRGYDVVACPDDQVYLDYRQSEREDEPIPVSIPLTLEDAYAFNPIPDGLSREETEHVIGGQANIWTEHMDSPRTVDYFAFPRLCAIAEALWLGEGSRRSLSDFEARLDKHLERLDAIGVEYRRADGPRPWQTRPGVIGRPATREQRAAHMATLVADIS